MVESTRNDKNEIGKDLLSLQFQQPPITDRTGAKTKKMYKYKYIFHLAQVHTEA